MTSINATAPDPARFDCAPECDCYPPGHDLLGRPHLSDCATRMPHPPRDACPLVMGGQGRDAEEVVDCGAAVAWAVIAMALFAGTAIGGVVVRWWMS